MADLELGGPLDLAGTLRLVGDGGKVLVNGTEALVEQAKGKGVPVIQPPPPSTPLDDDPGATVVNSLGKTITAKDKALVTTGMVMQGKGSGTWPGMMPPSSTNAAPKQVSANGLPVNVKGDTAIVFPNGGTATFSDGSGQ